MGNEVFLFRSWRLVFLYLSCFIVLVLSSVEENLLTGDKDLIEGDMKLTLDQKIELLAGSGGQKIFKDTKLWPGGIVTYDIDTSLAHDMKALFAIWLAMKEFERKTCIRFQKRKTENEYIWFYRGVGCWSHVGKTGLKQPISLAPDCWFYGIVVHEIAHSLGCFHEH
ncbi:unnamed protein product [Porites lobata]|uniref:Metalloendopeptidase n=1 Tax=Porites lobata TaxID=104759 RepID=A0ABN8PIS5_9CNID|nr:unnamed protein product [Porites lobata]